jgi:hypothetical protein
MADEIIDISNGALSLTDSYCKAVEIMSDKALRLRRSRTEPDIIHVREGKAGQVWRYVKRIAVMEWLDRNYPGWSFEVVPDSFKEYGGLVMAIGKLTVFEPETGLKRIVSCTGSDEIEFRKDDKKIPVSMTYYKNAETDALKRCVFTLGGFTDVYTDEEESSEPIVADEELGWFIKNALKLLLKRHADGKITARNLFKSICGFMRGDISKEKIIKAFPELTININN